MSNTKYVCDVCHKRLGKRYRNIFIYETIKADEIELGDYGNCEKELKVCNDCITDLNFLPIKNTKGGKN